MVVCILPSSDTVSQTFYSFPLYSTFLRHIQVMLLHAWRIFHLFTEIPSPVAMLDIEFGYNDSYNLVPTDSEDPQVGCILGSFVILFQPGINPLAAGSVSAECWVCQHSRVYTEGAQVCCCPQQEITVSKKYFLDFGHITSQSSKENTLEIFCVLTFSQHQCGFVEKITPWVL